MTRKEFSALLLELRKKHGPTMKELCFKLDTLPPNIYRIEKGAHNYNMQKCIDYIRTSNLELLVTDRDGFQYIISDYKQFVDCVKEIRTRTHTQQELAEKIGGSSVSISNFETMKSTITIDKTLNIADALGFTLSVVPKQ